MSYFLGVSICLFVFTYRQDQLIPSFLKLFSSRTLSFRYNILATFEFVKELSQESRITNNVEIQLIKKISKEEKITGGFIPPDIQICYQVLEIVLQTFGAIGVIDKFTGDRISKQTAKAITNLQKKHKN